MPFYESNRKIIGSKHTKLDTNNNLCHKIEPSEGAVIVMEIDEFWHYLKKNSGFSNVIRDNLSTGKLETSNLHTID